MEDKDKDEDEFYTPRELAPIPEFLDFENEEEPPGNIMPEQRRNQEAKRIKILTPQQMLSRLPIS